MIKVSIIIPVYNVEEYLRQCLDSAMHQTLREIEIICIDDGSTDASGAILEEYAAQDSRFIVLHQENSGQGPARNRGLKRVQGEYIAFLDSDDWLDLSFCEKMYQRAIESQAEVVTCLPYLLEGSYKNNIPYQNIDFSDRFTLQERLDVIDFAIEAWNHLWKTEMIRKYHIQFSSLRSVEDLPFTVCGLVFTQKLSFIKEPLYYYRCRPDSAGKSVKNFLESPQVYEAIFQHLQKYQHSENWKETFLYKKWSNLFQIYQIVRKEQESIKKYLENIRCHLSPEDISFWQKFQKNFPKKNQLFYKYYVLQQEMPWTDSFHGWISNYLRQAAWNRELKKQVKKFRFWRKK